MLAVRGLLSLGIVACTAVLVGPWPADESHAQTPRQASAIVGAWTLNKDLTDKPDGRDHEDAPRGRADGSGRRGVDRDAMTRVRDAMRDIMNPPEHLTIVDSGSIVILTGTDGRTTRLAPGGRKIKDENTGIERKTRWDGGRLVSEISGAVPGKVVETFEVNPERHQLTITMQMDGGRSGQPRTTAHIYDADPR